LTVVSIFVNPAQFAPHEDLATYPRTLPTDVKLLEAIEAHRKPSVIFTPGVNEMYPSGIVQKVDEQKGTFVEVKGYGHQMEGMSRPTFFRGVATVVTKLFNIVQVSLSSFELICV
jgi:pantoate--beta-alanine ligase